MDQQCLDCGRTGAALKKPCPKHPVLEYLGYVMGEGVSVRPAGYHSFAARICTLEEVLKTANALLAESSGRRVKSKRDPKSRSKVR